MKSALDVIRRIQFFLQWNWDSIYPVFFNNCRRLPETKRHSSLFLHWSGSKFLAVMAACTPSLHVFLGLPFFLLSHNLEFRFLFSKYKVKVDIQRNEIFMRHISPVDWNINLITLQFSTDLTFGANRWKKKDCSACSRNCGRDFFVFFFYVLWSCPGYNLFLQICVVSNLLKTRILWWRGRFETARKTLSGK